jgi:hypothetical protein
MDKELKRKLLNEILSRIPFLQASLRTSLLDAILAIDDITVEEQTKIAEEKKAEEIAELEAKKAEAQAVIDEAEAKLATLTKESIEIIK